MTVTLSKACVEEAKKYEVTTEQLEVLAERLDKSFDLGLSNNPDDNKQSSVKMYVTHLAVVPNGSESGRYFSLDLGGTKMRFFEMELSDKTIRSQAVFFDVPATAMQGSSEDLFDFISQAIQDGLAKCGASDVEIPLFGFTFSFPCLQTALNSGTLVRWTKGYSTRGVVGENVVEKLKASCVKRGLNIKDFALINDTTGTLLCGAFEDGDTCVGIINGTGTNACYIEDLSKVKKYSGSTKTGKMLINTEWGAFGEMNELKEYTTEMDTFIDKHSINPGQQIYEKMMSGMYVGELVRLSLLNIHAKEKIFELECPSMMLKEHSFPATLLSESYSQQQFVDTFKELYNYCLTDREFHNISYLCDAVSKRSARLSAAGLVAAVRRVSAKRCVIAGDGSMFRKHPKFSTYVMEAIKEMKHDKQVDIVLVDDGSGKGAAFAACVANSST